MNLVLATLVAVGTQPFVVTWNQSQFQIMKQAISLHLILSRKSVIGKFRALGLALFLLVHHCDPPTCVSLFWR